MWHYFTTEIDQFYWKKRLQIFTSVNIILKIIHHSYIYQAE